MNEPQRAEINTERFGSSEMTACPSCRSTLIRGMRFCRQCGFRLGEGTAEYVETMRFDGMPTISNFAPLATRSAADFNMQTKALAPDLAAASRRGRSIWTCQSKRMHWTMWIVLAVAISSASSGGLFRSGNHHLGGIGFSIPNTPRSFFGTSSGFVDAGGGGAMLPMALPNGPAYKAGLVGGDIIMNFDGQPVRTSGDMNRLLRATPIGKSVEVVYVRDGTTMRTTMETISSADYERNSSLFAAPKGKSGFLGVNSGSLSRMHVPGEEIYGVRVGNVLSNRPADLAGLHDGDIVVEFNGTPIRTAEELGSRITLAAPGSIANVVVVRDGRRLDIPIKMGSIN